MRVTSASWAAGAAALAGALLLVAAPARAATLEVCASGCAYTEIQAAVSAAAPGDTIQIHAGTYAEGINVSKAVSLVGAGPGSTILVPPAGILSDFLYVDADGAGISSLTLQPGIYGAVEVASGRMVGVSDVRCEGTGTCLVARGSAQVEVSDSTVVTDGTDNVFYVDSGAWLSILSTTFDGVIADYGVEMWSSGHVVLDGVTVDGGDYSGSFVYGRTFATIEATGSDFRDFSAGGGVAEGEAVLFTTGTIQLDGCTFSGVTLPSSSPGLVRLSHTSGTSSIAGSDFTCAMDLPAVLANGTLNVTDSVFTGCAPGLEVQRATTVARTAFRSNTPRSGGGGAGMHVRFPAPTIDVVDSVFEDNAGSGLWIDDSFGNLTVLRSRFCSNDYVGPGSGLYVESSQSVQVANTLFGGNRTSILGGAAVYVDSGGDAVTLDHVAVLGNEAATGSFAGGAINAAVDIALTNSLVAYTVSGDGLIAPATSTVQYDAFFANVTEDAVGPSLDSTNVLADPLLLGYDSTDPCASDLRLWSDSPLVDAGTGPDDLDGSPADIGIHGGADADPAMWTDGDSDGAPWVLDCALADPGVGAGIAESCDGVDQDCDRLVDEGFAGVGVACTAGVGACERSGSTVCSSDGSAVVCDATPGTPGTELCGTGVDEDCDGTADEGFPSVGSSCSAGVGACQRTGTTVCSSDGTTTECDATPGTPATELCGTGVDEDCDGTADEGFPSVGASCTAGVGACERSGTIVCSSDGTTTECDATPGTPGTETCDGSDEDCDGTADDGSGLCAGDPDGTACLGAGGSGARCGCASDGDCATGRMCDTGTATCEPEPDAGTPDAGTADAGTGTDAGTDLDAGTPTDAGAGLDAGPLADAGTGLDAGGGLDAGPAPDAGPMADAGPGDAGDDAAVPADGAVADGGLPDAGSAPVPSDDGGCSCHTTGGPASSPWWLAGLVAAILVRRRRRLGR